MSRFDEVYEFRTATVNDIDNIMKFIEKEWKAIHIFATDKEFFCYEHQNGERFNFVLAIDKETGEIAGLQGFIPYSDDEASKIYAVSGVIIKAKTPSKVPCLGVEIMKQVARLVPYKDYCAVGVNPRTCLPLVKHYMRRWVGAMQHYYRLNPSIKEYHIAKITDKIIGEITGENGYELKQPDCIEEAAYDFSRHFDNLPYKNRWYINKRYFCHPIYQYKVMDVVNREGTSEGLLIGREITVGESRIMRLVDFIGNTDCISGIGTGVNSLMLDHNYEYVDFILEGVAEDQLQMAGFVMNKNDSGNIIPNYFEPFVPENITLWFEKSKENMVLFKADGDQDRPNYR